MANWWTWTLIYFPSQTDIILSQRCMQRGFVRLLSRNWVSTNPIPLLQKAEWGAAIKAVNNPSHQLRRRRRRERENGRRWCRRTQSGVCSSNRDVTSLTRYSLRFQLTFGGAGWPKLLQTNMISTEDVLLNAKCKITVFSAKWSHCDIWQNTKQRAKVYFTR